MAVINPYWSVNLSLLISSGVYYSPATNDLRIPYGTPDVRTALAGCRVAGKVEFVMPPYPEGTSEDIINTTVFDNTWRQTQDGLYEYKINVSWVDSTNSAVIKAIVYLRNRGEQEAEITDTLTTTAVKRYKDLVLISSTSETGSQSSPLVVTVNGITIGKSSFSAFVTDYSDQRTDVTSSVVWSKDTFTLDEVIALAGNPYNITISYTYGSQTISSLLTVYLEPTSIASAIINGTDSALNYYQNEDSYFVTPTFTLAAGKTYLYTFVYVDGTEVDIDPYDIDTIEYTLGNSGTQTALVAGTSIIPAGYSKLYARITLNNGEVAYAPYNIYRKADTVESISCSPDFDFVLGNKLEKYKGNEIQVTAHWTNPAKADTTNFTDFTFDYTSIVMSGSDLGVSTTIHIGASQFTISLSSISFVEPDISAVEITNNTGIKNSYQNEIDKIDLTNVKLLIRYEDAEYTKEVVFDDNKTYTDADKTAPANKFGVMAKNSSGTQILADVDYFDGTNELDLSDVSSIYDCKFQFIVKNDFTTLSDIELEVPFKVMTIYDKITGIRIMSSHNDYKVGEEFLNDDDDTIVRLYYKAVDNGGTEYIANIDVYLKDDFQAISTNYPKGTVWTQPDSSKSIVVKSVFNPSLSAEYSITVTYDGYVSGSKTHDLVVVWIPAIIPGSWIEWPNGPFYSEPNGLLGIYDEEDTEVIDGIRSLKAGITPILRGYIRNIFNTNTLDSQAVMVLFEDYTPPISSSPNIVINFPSYNGLADNINKCRFGILFGNNNANNRLFVSGNPDVRNADWHSGETNAIHTEGEVERTNGDFSYFPNENVMYYGETDNKVIGYDIVANDKLLVLKDKSDKEKTVYFRTPTLVTALASTGVSSEDIQGANGYQEEFALVKGNNSVAGVSPHSIINLNGDTLFVDSDNTIQGLDLTGIVGDNQRYANSRSRYLDGLLKDLDLKDAFLWSNNKYLFMPVKDKGIFVTNVNAFNDETRQYDWWLLDSENPTCFVEIDDVVYFGNGDGNLYQMRNGEYRDELKVFVNEGQGVLAKVNDDSFPKVIDGIEIPAESIVVNKDVFDQLYPDGDYNRELYFRSINTYPTYVGSIFYQIGSITNNDEEYDIDLLIVEEDGVHYLEVASIVNGSYNTERQLQLVRLLKENQDYYINYYKAEGVQEVSCNQASQFYNNYNAKFRLVSVPSTGNDRYLMEIYNNATDQWENIDLADLYKANLVAKLEGDYQLYDVDPDTYSFKLKDDAGYPMNIVIYGNQGIANTFTAEIIWRKNVVAYYITAPMSMGSISYFKTIWSFTFTNDTGEKSEYDLAIASNKIPDVKYKEISTISKPQIGTNFLDFVFKSVDFDKDIVPRTYTIQRTLGMQKFVCLVFKNDNDSNSILSSLSVIYTLPFPSYGSD